MFRRLPFPLLLLLVGLTAVAPAAAQPASEPAAPVAPGDELTVYLMTMGPGAYVWERFGHNAIWIHDAARGTDVAYNYGMFSFEQENFLLRFVRGQMDYWMEGFDALLTADVYVRQGRSVWAQELNLTAAQKTELRDFLEWNARPENRFYRYDYYRDNCSTRVRDAIDRVLGGQLREQTGDLPTGTTYRTHTKQLTGADPLLYTGLMLGLGEPVDREISAWEEMFLPMELREWASRLTIVDPTGARVPLVRGEEVIHLAAGDAAGVGFAEVPSFLVTYLALGLLVAGGILLGGRLARRRRDVAMAFRLLAATWCAVGGVLGVVLVGLWALTDHTVAYRNENLFFANPLLLALAFLLPLAVRREAWRSAAWWFAAAVAALSVLGTLVKVLPGFDQANAEIVALMLPVNVALALTAWWFRAEDGAGARSGAAPAPRRGPVHG